MENSLNVKTSWLHRNAANIVTGLRFPLCAVLFWVIVAHTSCRWTIFSLFFAACATDWIDGWIANRLKIVSKIGGALDRLADKFLLANLFLFLILDGQVHISLKVIAVPASVVEALLLIYWYKGLKNKMDVSTVKAKEGFGPGQIKMFALCVVYMLILLNLIVEPGLGATYSLCANIALNIMFAICLYYGVMSFLSHRKRHNAHNPE